MRLFESNPPLYYALAWVWAHAFGTGELTLRLLPALAGIATIPVTYVAAAALVSQRAGLISSALVAVSPPLVWYSQENRSYGLLVLLGALTVMFWAQALTTARRRALVGWAVSSGLALLTHYFAIFLIAPQAGWLLARSPYRRRAVAAVAAVLGVGLAVLPLALAQRTTNADWVHTLSLGWRVGEAGRIFAGGSPFIPNWVVAPVGLLLIAALAGLKGVTADIRPRLVALATICAVALLLPLLMALTGVDYLIGRNLIGVWVPVLILVATGLACQFDRVAFRSLAVALTLVCLALVVAVPLDRSLQREVVSASLFGVHFDVNRDRLIPVVTFARAGGSSAAATCPGGYTVGNGFGLLVTKRGRRPIHSSGDRRRLVARSPRGATAHELLLVFANCVRPR
jgi:uncharacterized membrane protein